MTKTDPTQSPGDSKEERERLADILFQSVNKLGEPHIYRIGDYVDELELEAIAKFLAANFTSNEKVRAAQLDLVPEKLNEDSRDHLGRPIKPMVRTGWNYCRAAMLRKIGWPEEDLGLDEQEGKS